MYAIRSYYGQHFNISDIELRIGNGFKINGACFFINKLFDFSLRGQVGKTGFQTKFSQCLFEQSIGMSEKTVSGNDISSGFG